MPIMFKYLLILLVAVTISSCSALEVLKNTVGPALGLSADKGISAELQVGDREFEGNVGGVQGSGKIQDVRGDVVVSTSQTESNVEQAERVIINNRPSPWLLLLLVMGWILPTPAGMWRGLTPLLRKKKIETK